MTNKDLILKKDYDYVSYRLTHPNFSKGIFAGAFKSENGKIISLDGDVYNENEEVLYYKEFSNKDADVVKGLEILCKGTWDVLILSKH